MGNSHIEWSFILLVAYAWYMRVTGKTNGIWVKDESAIHFDMMGRECVLNFGEREAVE